MNYRDLNLLTSYETGINDLIGDFYIPVLENTKRYDRIAGFFSSSSFALSARGVAGLILNKGTMRLLTCPKLESKDLNVIKDVINNPALIEDSMCNELDSITDDFQRDHVAALGWLLSHKILEMKIALVHNNGIFLDETNELSQSIMHQKVGVLYDENYNGISFSGSINESASGWLYNIEEFKVFRSWSEGQKEYFDNDRNRFERLWNGNNPFVIVKDLPQAVSEKLIKEGESFEISKLSIARYLAKSRTQIPNIPQKEKLKLFPYQEEAVKIWENNNRCLLLQMATGTGKTRTAIGCIKTVIKEVVMPLLIVISCPGNTLSTQWKKDIEKLDISYDSSLICDGTNSNWRNEFELLLKKLSTQAYDTAIVLTTHDTCSSADFISILKRNIKKTKTFFIGDEVHGLGAKQTQNGLLELYQMRLGLSATPSRWFDPAGTERISLYFGNKSFEFTISDALRTINPITGKPFLVNYHYHPHFVQLTEEELGKYNELSKKINRMISKQNKEEMKKIFERLLFKRAEIEKSAENKYLELEKILSEIGPRIESTIIFVSPNQKDKVLNILANRKIDAHSFTQQEGTIPSKKYDGLSERNFIIKQFDRKEYKVLVAIKCLDEGIDIPSAQRAIIMASSTNPREYTQRIGRVIRQDKNKQNAEIYDMIIRPDISNLHNEELKKLEQKIFLKEMDRVLDMSENSLDNVSTVKQMYKIKEEYSYV